MYFIAPEMHFETYVGIGWNKMFYWKIYTFKHVRKYILTNMPYGAQHVFFPDLET